MGRLSVGVVLHQHHVSAPVGQALHGQSIDRVVAIGIKQAEFFWSGRASGCLQYRA